jgi:hypothetical protein
VPTKHFLWKLLEAKREKKNSSQRDFLDTTSFDYSPRTFVDSKNYQKIHTRAGKNRKSVSATGFDLTLLVQFSKR